MKEYNIPLVDEKIKGDIQFVLDKYDVEGIELEYCWKEHKSRELFSGVFPIAGKDGLGFSFCVEVPRNNLKANKEQIDELINKYAKNWSVNRMAKVDLSILRLAICELVFVEEIPSKVSINEAIEMAKLYCDDKAPKFINGILGSVVNEFETK